MSDFEDVEAVQQLVAGHLTRCTDQRPLWNRYRAAYEGRFWNAENRWSALMARSDGEVKEKLPVKVETNMIRPFIHSLYAGLFYRGPRFAADLPRVREVRRGRPAKLDRAAPETVAAIASEWLARTTMKRVAKSAYGQAFMYGAAALKLGYTGSSSGVDLLNRVWCTVVPRWEAMWDERVMDGGPGRYQAHLRHEPLDWVVEEFGSDAKGELEPRALPDYVLNGYRLEGDEQKLERGRDKGYVLVLEFWDLVDERTRWFVGQAPSDNEVALRPIGDDELPYTMPDGQRCHTLIPIVLDSTPEFPLQGLPAVDGLYEINAERNLLQSYLACAFRRDAARVVLYMKDKGIDDDVISRLEEGDDLALIGVPGPVLAGLFQTLEMPRLPGTFDSYLRFLEMARQDTRGTTDLTQGKQGRYLSATEAQLLAQYSDTTTGELASQMDDAINHAGAVMLTILREEMAGAKFAVDVAGKPIVVSKDVLDLPWRLLLQDTSTTPAREQQRRVELQQVQKPLLELARIAAGVPEEAGGQPDQLPVQLLAQRLLDHSVMLYDLPENMRWEAISKDGKAKEEPAAGVDPARLEQAKQILGLLGQAQAGGPPGALPPGAGMPPMLPGPAVPALPGPVGP